MTSRQRLGIILVILGGFMFLNNVYPEFFKNILSFITFPVVLVVIGLYLILVKK